MFSILRFSSRAVVFLIGLTLVATISEAATVYDYVDWTSDTLSTGSTNGSVAGTIATSQGTVNVTYSGDVVAPTQINNSGNDYYTAWQSVYTNAVVSNSPTNVDVIALSEASSYTDTITFSTAVTDPILDIVSLGAAKDEVTVSYLFSATPVLLSQGPGWYRGCSTCLSVNGNTLIGMEGDGVVEFVGTYTSISWTTTGAESWNGFTLGAADDSVPEPATWIGLLIASMLAVPFVRRRKNRLAA